jgi:hypothetical protein
MSLLHNAYDVHLSILLETVMPALIAMVIYQSSPTDLVNNSLVVVFDMTLTDYPLSNHHLLYHSQTDNFSQYL